MGIIDKVFQPLSVIGGVTHFVFWFIVLIVALSSQYLLDSAFVAEACSNGCSTTFNSKTDTYTCCYSTASTPQLGLHSTVRFYNWLLFCFLTVHFLTMPLGKLAVRPFTIAVSSVIVLLYIPYFQEVKDGQLAGLCTGGGCFSYSDTLGKTSGLPVLVLSPLLITWSLAAFELFTFYRNRKDGGSSSSSGSGHVAVVSSLAAPVRVSSAGGNPYATSDVPPSSPTTRQSNAISPYDP